MTEKGITLSDGARRRGIRCAGLIIFRVGALIGSNPRACSTEAPTGTEAAHEHLFPLLQHVRPSLSFLDNVKLELAAICVAFLDNRMPYPVF